MERTEHSWKENGTNSILFCSIIEFPSRMASFVKESSGNKIYGTQIMKDSFAYICLKSMGDYYPIFLLSFYWSLHEVNKIRHQIFGLFLWAQLILHNRFCRFYITMHLDCKMVDYYFENTQKWRSSIDIISKLSSQNRAVGTVLMTEKHERQKTFRLDGHRRGWTIWDGQIFDCKLFVIHMEIYRFYLL